jgi:hypothetical protein
MGATALTAAIWASRHLVADQRKPSPFIAITIVAATLLGYSWWGSVRSDDTELMRAQVLRRLGHTATADRIEAQLMPSPAPVDE